MVKISLDNLKDLFINGKQIKSLFVQGKPIKMSYNVSFNTNMSNYYYIAGQGGDATTVAAPPTQVVPVGSAIGTLPSMGPLTYTLSGYSYSIYVTGWYLEPSLTNQVTTDWVPTGDATLYAKWKMTANVSIAASITVPKFASSVSWVCYSNGGSRSARSETASGGSVDMVMAAPGADRQADSYTWTGAIGGQALTLQAQSLTLNGITRSVTTPGEAGSWHVSKRVLGDIIASSGGTLAAGSKTYSSGNYTIIVSWPRIVDGSSGYLTIYFYYAGSLKAAVATQYRIDIDTDSFPNRKYVVLTRTYSGTFSSGHYGAAGAYGCASYHTSSVSKVTVAAAAGSGYYRAVTVNA